MNIMTATGPRNFYNPETPQFTEEHKVRIKDLIKTINSLDIRGWSRKCPKVPPMNYEFELLNQVVLTHIPQVEHPSVKV